MAIAEWKLIGTCLEKTVETYICRKYAISYIDHLLKSGLIGARGSHVELQRGWEYAKPKELTHITPKFWRAVETSDVDFSDAHWDLSAFSASYESGTESVISDFGWNYVGVEIDWSILEKLLQSPDFVPPYFVDDTQLSVERSYEEENLGPGPTRADTWQEWIAEVVQRAHDNQIPSSMRATRLMEAIAAQLSKRGLLAPSRSTVRPAADAILRRLYPKAEQ